MSFDSLRLFRDVAQNRSISKAAENNDISVSAASQQMDALERSLGVRLLDRSTRPLSLTAEGRLYSDMCRDVLRRYEQFRADLGRLKSSVEGSVRIAAIYSVGLSEMTELEAEFRRQFPAVEFEVAYLRPEKVYEAVIEDRVDIGLVSYPAPAREITVVPWRREQMMVVGSPANALLREAEIVPSALSGVDFIGFDEDLPIARDIDAYLEEHGVEVNIVMRFDNIQTIKEALLLGSGLSILPGRIVRSELAEGRLAAAPLAAPGLYRPLGIIHRKKKRFSRAAQIFLDLLQREPAAEPLQHTGA